MTNTKEPYFMTNPEWYTFDEEQFKYVLTEKAPKKAVESYKTFYEIHSIIALERKKLLKHVQNV